MLERINGYDKASVLGYFYGKNAFVSVAVNNASNINVYATGAAAALVELQHYLNSTDDNVLLAYINARGITRIDGTAFVLATVEADYTAAYAAQSNLRRIVDVIQQRAVIDITSSISNNVACTNFLNAPSGVTGTVSLTAANVVTFLVERANVFDKTIMTAQGIPTGTTDIGRNLIDDLAGITLYATDGVTTVTLASSATVATAGNYGIKVYQTCPALTA